MGSLAMTAAVPPVGMTITLSLKMGGEAQLVVAATGVVPQSGPPIRRVRPTRGSIAEAEAVVLREAADEAADGESKCTDQGGVCQLQPPVNNEPPFEWLKQTKPGHPGGAAPNLQPPPAMDKNAQAAAWWNSLSPAEQNQIQSKQTSKG